MKMSRFDSVKYDAQAQQLQEGFKTEFINKKAEDKICNNKTHNNKNLYHVS